ncbi:hypothetical protein Tco_0167478 [Tanacetum coccineum]
MSPNSYAITLRCVSVNVESLSLEPPVRDTIYSGDVIFAFLFNPHLIGAFQVLLFKFSDPLLFAEPVHKDCHITSLRESDDRMDQAGSGVAGLSSVSGFYQLYLSSSRIDQTDGLSLVSVVIQAVYSAKAAIFEELGTSVPVD